MFGWLLVPAGFVLVLFAVHLVKHLRRHSLQHFNDLRRDTSRVVGQGELVDGSRHIAVAMALGRSALYYENSDMEASLDLAWIKEIEYENELVSGQAVTPGKVLRIRSFGRMVEFILPESAIAQWQSNLPALRLVRATGA